MFYAVALRAACKRHLTQFGSSKLHSPAPNNDAIMTLKSSYCRGWRYQTIKFKMTARRVDSQLSFPQRDIFDGDQNLQKSRHSLQEEIRFPCLGIKYADVALMRGDLSLVPRTPPSRQTRSNYVSVYCANYTQAQSFDPIHCIPELW